MIALIFSWILYTALSYPFGFSVFNLIFRKKKENEVGPNFFITCIVGIFIITAIASFLSIFIKLGLAALVIISLIGLLLFVFQFKKIKETLLSAVKKSHLPSWFLSLALLLLVFAIWFTIRPADNYDTGLYHAQSIRWLEEFGVVKGLGNFHERLTFNSSWFVTTASFSLSFLGHSLHLVNGWLFAIFAFFLLSGFSVFWTRECKLSDIAKILFFPLLIYIYIDGISSPSPDLPNSVMVWAVIILFLNKVDRRKFAFDYETMAITILAFFAFTIKLSSAPIVLVPIYLLIKERKTLTIQQLFFAFLTVILIDTPFIVRNIIQSGYLIYPFVYINIFNFDWKIPGYLVVDVQRTTTNWAKVGSSEDPLLHQGFGAWIPAWYQAKSLFNKILLDLTLFLSLFSLSFWMPFAIKKNTQKTFRIEPFVVLTLIAGIGFAFWFVSAPDFRYGYVFIIPMIALLLIPIVKYLIDHFPKTQFIFFSAGLFFLMYSLFIRYGLLQFSDISNHLKLPPDYQKTVVNANIINDKKILSPSYGDQCWYADLPCTPYPSTKLKWRGDTLKDGFYWKD